MTEAATTLHERIRADIEGRIVSGDWPPGHRVPFEHELTAEYGCSRMTVNKALTELARAGMIERRRKSGSFVRRPQSQSAVLEIKDIRAEVEALGLPYRYRIVSRRRGRADKAHRVRLSLGAAAQVVDVCCLHMAGARPFCLEERLISLDAVPDAAAESFESRSPGRWLLARTPWSAAEHVIRAVAATEAQAALLGVQAGAACLVVERRTWDQDRPVTHVVLTYAGEDHSLTARFAPGG